MKYSDHPVATGGSPIVTWLPNQLSAIMDLITKFSTEVDVSKLDNEHKAIHEKIQSTAETQNRILKREVEALNAKYPNAGSDAKTDYHKSD